MCGERLAFVGFLEDCKYYGVCGPHPQGDHGEEPYNFDKV